MEGSGEEEEDFLFLVSLLYTSFLTLAEVLSLHTRANIRKKFCEKRAGQGAGGGLSFFSCHCSFPATDHTSLSLPSPCFRSVPTICEPETDNRNTGKINPRIKSFLSPSPPVIHSLLGWWQTNSKLTALTQGQICLKGPVYWEWRISPSSKFSQKPITAFHTI